MLGPAVPNMDVSLAALFILHFMVPTAITSLIAYTIDDENGDSRTGAKPIFEPDGGWAQGSQCTSCNMAPGRVVDVSHAFDGTWHDSTYHPGSPDRVITAPFQGTELTVYFIIPNTVPSTTTLVNLSFSIDGVYMSQYQHHPDSTSNIAYKVPVFSTTNLASIDHTVEIRANGPTASLLLFDYMSYVVEHDDISSSASTSTATLTHSSTSSRSASPPPAPPPSSHSSSTITSSADPPTTTRVPATSSPSYTVSPSQISSPMPGSIEPAPSPSQSSSSQPTGESSTSTFTQLSSSSVSAPARGPTVSSAAAVGGGVAGGLVLLALAVMLALCCRRRRARRTPASSHALVEKPAIFVPELANRKSAAPPGSPGDTHVASTSGAHRSVLPARRPAYAPHSPSNEWLAHFPPHPVTTDLEEMLPLSSYSTGPPPVSAGPRAALSDTATSTYPPSTTRTGESTLKAEVAALREELARLQGAGAEMHRLFVEPPPEYEE